MNSSQSSRKTNDNACELCENLHKQVQQINLTLEKLVVVQEGLSKQIHTIAEHYLQCAPNPGPETKPTDGQEMLRTGRYPQFNSGKRLINAPELLEMVLLELPSEDVLVFQRVNRAFRSVIAGSQPLQSHLFFTTNCTPIFPNSALLNPIIAQESTLNRIPLYFDENKCTLAYCPGGGRTRVYCKTITISRDEGTGQKSINMVLDNLGFAFRVDGFGRERPASLGPGSWRRMYLSQPPCQIT